MFAWRNTLEKMSELNLWFNFCSKIKLEWGRGNVQLIWIWLTIKETCLLCIWSQNQIFNARLEHGSAFLPSRTRNGGTVEPEVSSNRLHGSVPRSLSTLHSVIDLSSLVSSIRFGSRETRPASASARQLTPFSFGILFLARAFLGMKRKTRRRIASITRPVPSTLIRATVRYTWMNLGLYLWSFRVITTRFS